MILLEIIFEILLEIVIELISSSVSAQTGSRFPIKQKHPVLSLAGYLLAGGLLGLVSVSLLPNHFVQHPTLRILTLVIGPLIAGWVMSKKGQWLNKRGKEEVGLDHFWSGAAFAFMFMLMRFIFAH